MSSYLNPEFLKTARTADQTAKQMLASIRLVKKELKDIVSRIKDGKYSEIEHQTETAIAYLETVCHMSQSPVAKSIESGEIDNPGVSAEDESEASPDVSAASPEASAGASDSLPSDVQKVRLSSVSFAFGK